MKTLFTFLLSGILAISAVYGQQDNDLARIDQFIGKKISIKKEKLDPEALGKVFRGSFYRATPEYAYNNGTSSCGEFNVVVVDGAIFDLENIDETKTLEMLATLLRSDFAIQNEEDARTFELALDAIYPLSWSDKPEDKKHMKKDDQWIFLRGKFFDALKGFVVSLDENYRIRQIEYQLKAE